MHRHSLESYRKNGQDRSNLEILETLFRVWGWYQAVAFIVVLFLLFYWSRFMASIYAMSPGSSDQDLGRTYVSTLSFIGALSFTDIVGCILSFLAAYWIKNRTNLRYVRSCAAFMFVRGLIGIGLAVYSLAILNQESVKAMFGATGQNGLANRP